MEITIKEILYLKNRLREINSIPIEDITFIDEHNQTLQIDDEILNEWKYTGLNNSDFIETEFYKFYKKDYNY